MGRTVMVSPAKIDTDSVMAMTMFLLLTSTAPVRASVNLPELIDNSEHKISFDFVPPNYSFGNEQEDNRHDLWFAPDTDQVCFFDTGRQGNGKFVVYDHHYPKPDFNLKRPKSATRVVWEKHKNQFNGDPIIFSLLEEIVDWVDEMDSRETDYEQNIKESLYSVLAPAALEAVGYKRLKLYTNHMPVLSYLPKYLGQMGRKLADANSLQAKIFHFQNIFKNISESLSSYLSGGYRNRLEEAADWEVLSARMTVTELNPLLDLVVIRESPLHISTLRYRLNQRYADPLLKKHYLLITTFQKSKNLRIHKSFPFGFAELDLSKLRDEFMERYSLDKRYTRLESYSAVSLNGVKDIPGIMDDLIQCSKDNLKMQIPAEQITGFVAMTHKMADLLTANAAEAQVNSEFLAAMENLIEKFTSASVNEVREVGENT